MSSCLFFLQPPACLVHLRWMVCEMRCKNIVCIFFVVPISYFFLVVQPYSSTAWKKFYLILTKRSDIYMIDNLSIFNLYSISFDMYIFNPYLLSYCPLKKTNTKYNLTQHLTRMIPNDLYIWKLTCHHIFLVSLGNPTFSNMFPRARHILMILKLWTLCAHLCIFLLYISHLLQSSQQASIAMWTILISKSWWWLLKPKC